MLWAQGLLVWLEGVGFLGRGFTGLGSQDAP